MFSLIKLSSYKNSYKYLNKLSEYLYSSIILSINNINIAEYINNSDIIIININLDNINYNLNKIKEIVPKDKILYIILEYSNLNDAKEFINSIKEEYSNYHGALILKNTIFNHKKKEKKYNLFRYKVKYNIIIIDNK